jgi:hypothetical protein
MLFFQFCGRSLPIRRPVRGGNTPLPEAYIEFVMGAGFMVSTVWLSAAAIVAWHHVLVELASHRSEPRMLV